MIGGGTRCARLLPIGDAMKLIHIGAGSAIGIGVICGCVHNDDAVATTTTTSAVTVPGDTAVENIAYGRCTHENACNSVGAGREWESLASCMDATRGKASRAIACARGIDAYALQGCMNAIDMWPCTMAELPSECSTAKLCM